MTHLRVYGDGLDGSVEPENGFRLKWLWLQS
jgi:hypothetical protein